MNSLSTSEHASTPTSSICSFGCRMRWPSACTRPSATLVYRRVLGYYSGTEDAFDMRKGRDKEKKSVGRCSTLFCQRFEW